MWSEYSLEVVDAVARNGSFSAAAQELHRVPSAVSYTVRQLEEWLAVPLFERRHRDVELTPALLWLLDYLGDSETLNREWLRAPE